MRVFVRLSWALLTVISFALSFLIWNDPWENELELNPFLFQHHQAVSICEKIHIKQYPAIDEFIWVDQIAAPLNYFEVRMRLREYAFKTPSYLTVRVLVDEKGHYVKHKIIERKYEFHARLLDKFVKDMRFRPAYRNNKAVSSWRNISFSF